MSAAPERRLLALTGTPGTGKTAAARALPGRLRAVEVGELARRAGAARRGPEGLEVDLARLGAALRRGTVGGDVDIVVGYLAHRLPIRDVVVLRCHPAELIRRLVRARRGRPRDREENYLAEALDVVLIDALRPGRRVWEVDTTGRTPEAVARAVRERFLHRGRSSVGRVDWLGDPEVTAHLLDPAP